MDGLLCVVLVRDNRVSLLNCLEPYVRDLLFNVIVFVSLVGHAVFLTSDSTVKHP